MVTPCLGVSAPVKSAQDNDLRVPMGCGTDWHKGRYVSRTPITICRITKLRDVNLGREFHANYVFGV